MLKKIVDSCVLSFMLLLLLPGMSAAQTLTAKTEIIDTNCHGFYQWLPAGYDKTGSEYPLLILLHGMGELGNGESELPKVLRNGAMKLVAENKFPSSFMVNNTEYHFIIFAPQFIHWPWPGTVYAILKYALTHYRVDQKRIYLSGLSMGGGATWECVGNSREWAEKLAAIVPVCGASLADSSKAAIIASAGLPVWATHNQGDPVVTVEFTEKYIKYIKAVPGQVKMDVRKTIFPETNHNAWTKTYDPAWKEDGMNIYEWMLSHHR